MTQPGAALGFNFPARDSKQLHSCCSCCLDLVYHKACLRAENIPAQLLNVFVLCSLCNGGMGRRRGRPSLRCRIPWRRPSAQLSRPTTGAGAAPCMSAGRRSPGCSAGMGPSSPRGSATIASSSQVCQLRGLTELSPGRGPGRNPACARSPLCSVMCSSVPRLLCASGCRWPYLRLSGNAVALCC